MEKNKCKDCGCDDIFVKIISPGKDTEDYQCSECYLEGHDSFTTIED